MWPCLALLVEVGQWPVVSVLAQCGWVHRLLYGGAPSLTWSCYMEWSSGSDSVVLPDCLVDDIKLRMMSLHVVGMKDSTVHVAVAAF